MDNDSFDGDSNLDEDECATRHLCLKNSMSAAPEEEDNVEIDDNDGRDDETSPESD